MRRHLSRVLVLSAFILSFLAPPFIREALSGDISGLKVSAGYRVDQFMWNIAGDTNGSNPNILSELTWTDLEMFLLKVTSRGHLTKGIYSRASIDYGIIQDGRNQDSDYLLNNRTLEFSRSNNSSDSGSVYDASAGVGYRLASVDEDVEFIPMAGYSYHRQNLSITEGFQTIPSTGFFAGLDSTYRARWMGPWLGFDLGFIRKDGALSASFEYHFMADYLAEANWNLRTDFMHPKSFEHTADGSGVVFSLEGDYSLTQNLSIGWGAEAQKWRTGAGVDRTFFASGAVVDTRLNEVVWSSYAVMAGMKWRFR